MLIAKFYNKQYNTIYNLTKISSGFPPKILQGSIQKLHDKFLLQFLAKFVENFIQIPSESSSWIALENLAGISSEISTKELLFRGNFGKDHEGLYLF